MEGGSPSCGESVSSPALLAAVPLAYDIVRYAGAAYLIYLGVHALTHAAPMWLLVYLKPTPIDISTYNFNGIDYALVRSEVVNRKPAM